MNLIELPEPLNCPDSWHYTSEWQEKYEDINGFDYLSKLCGHSDSGFRIMYYICDLGEMALTKVKAQNLFIKRISTNSLNPVDIGELDIDWQSGHTWKYLHQSWEELFEIYNASKAPPDISRIVDEVKSFMDTGNIHCQALLKYVSNAKAIHKEQQVKEREEARLKITQHRNKWEAIDVAHSKVKEGFVYLLSNELMPGVYKIGFTAQNPDKRAKEVSAKYKLPKPFKVVNYWRTKDPYILEQRIHSELASFRKVDELFEIDLESAREIIEFLISEL
jgi:hypothetical protein